MIRQLLIKLILSGVGCIAESYSCSVVLHEGIRSIYLGWIQIWIQGGSVLVMVVKSWTCKCIYHRILPMVGSLGQ